MNDYEAKLFERLEAIADAARALLAISFDLVETKWACEQFEPLAKALEELDKEQ